MMNLVPLHTVSSCMDLTGALFAHTTFVGILSHTVLVLVSFRGQGQPTGNSPPYFGPSLKLDFELEMVSLL